jgi:transcriptional regulator with XRE-family HTH domain
MPARGLAATPREYLARGEWPEGSLRRSAPYEALKVAEISQRLKVAIAGRSLRTVAADSGVSVGTLSNLLSGKTWGDVVTLARLERALGVELWSGTGHAGEPDNEPGRGVRTGRSDANTGRSDPNRPQKGRP